MKPSYKKENSLQLPPIHKKKKTIEFTPKRNEIRSETNLPIDQNKLKECETHYEYVSQMIKKISHFAFIFKISTGLALNLLIKCQYNVEEFYNLAFEHQKNKNLVDLKKLFSVTYGILDEECPICLKKSKPENMISLNCNHNFCRQCFFSYLTNLMSTEGKFCFLKTCPMENCPEYLSLNIFEELLKTDLKLLKKYQNLIAKAILDTLPANLKLCPAPNCTFIVKIDEKHNTNTAICPNNHVFCVKCLMFPHLPLTCKEFSFFLNASDLTQVQSDLWLCSKTKKCPSCQKDIEKNGGCNHMTCKMCSHQFCWMCLKNWDNHNTFKCNNTQKEINKMLEERKKKAIKRLNFYTELNKVKEKFEKNREETILMKNLFFKQFSAEQKNSDLMEKEKFKEYLLFAAELESFLFLGENYFKFFDLQPKEKNNIGKKLKEISNRVFRLNLSLKSRRANFLTIFNTFSTIKKNDNSNSKIYNQIKPLMNDVLKITEEKNRDVNQLFF